MADSKFAEDAKKDPRFQQFSEELDYNPEKQEKKVIIRGKIIHARYYPDEGYICVRLELQDGSCRATYLHKSSVVYNGKKLDATELERQMLKTADMFRQAKGRFVKLEMFERQAEL